ERDGGIDVTDVARRQAEAGRAEGGPGLRGGFDQRRRDKIVLLFRLDHLFRWDFLFFRLHFRLPQRGRRAGRAGRVALLLVQGERPAAPVGGEGRRGETGERESDGEGGQGLGGKSMDAHGLLRVVGRFIPGAAATGPKRHPAESTAASPGKALLL